MKISKAICSFIVHLGIIYFIATKYDVLLGKFLERLTILEELYSDRDGVTHLKSSDVTQGVASVDGDPANNLYCERHIFSMAAFGLYVEVKKTIF